MSDLSEMLYSLHPSLRSVLKEEDIVALFKDGLISNDETGGKLLEINPKQIVDLVSSYDLLNGRLDNAVENFLAIETDQNQIALKKDLDLSTASAKEVVSTESAASTVQNL